MSSIKCVSPSNGRAYDYVGLSADVSNLPTNGIGSGSTFLAVDTSEVYMFESTTQTWYKL